jgi:hypothetical protein
MDLYKKETGEDATYRKEGSTFHTLRYVDWLEFRLQKHDAIFLAEKYCETIPAGGVDEEVIQCFVSFVLSYRMSNDASNI